MGKLKINIKNLQLAGKLKPKSEEEAKAVEAPKKKKTRLLQELPDQTKIEEAAAPSLEEALPSPTLAEELGTPSPSVEKVEERQQAATAPETPVTPPAAAPQPKPASSAAPAPARPRTEAPRPTSARPPAIAPRPALPPAKDLRTKKKEELRTFDARDKQGLRDIDNEAWRKRRAHKTRYLPRMEEIQRPKSLLVRLPISIKDLAQAMKRKSSELIAKLFMKGMTLTLNDYLTDDVVVQLLGHDFDCDIQIDSTEEKRIRITDQTIKQEVETIARDQLVFRPPVVAFMGHVDHGKTSLIDTIRKSNRAADEAGAITQHIGAFQVETKAGNVTILDTPGHEAFSEMRSRGANVTDIVILVVAGDEGIKAQTEEAIRQAREAQVPILVAINKCDKPTFDQERVYRELSERELLPEAWGGTTITVNCSAVTGQGVENLLEMMALQAEVLELRAAPKFRARGTILESEMHKGLGAVATVLVQNGTLLKGDAIVFGHFFGRVKTMQDEFGRAINEAPPSTPVRITGLSELALAGSEFIVVKNEKEAKELATAREEEHHRGLSAATVRMSNLEKMMAKKSNSEMKILPLILRADVQGSLEALKNSLLKIHSKKVRLEIVNADVGEISESDIELAAASRATIVGFHTSIESHADALIKQKQVSIHTQDVIYHLIDWVKERMRALLDKIPEERNLGALRVKAIFTSSQLGTIAGCQVSDGIVKRQSLIRQIRGKEIIWKGKISSLKRLKEDVKEVKEGLECGVVLEGRSDLQEGDLLQAYEIHYLEQEL
ncbi:MAG: translation initiation factor IF-2 [Verrucomicrobiota bacterium]|nr:translation initiation factor IF-2 [Verrucomicrobiota bacterium]